MAQELIMLILREGCLPEPFGPVHSLVFGVDDRLLYIVHLQPTCSSVFWTGHALILDRPTSSDLCMITTPHQPSTCTRSACFNMRYQMTACSRHIGTVVQCLWTCKPNKCGLDAVLVLTVARYTRDLTQLVVGLSPRADVTRVEMEMRDLSYSTADSN